MCAVNQCQSFPLVGNGTEGTAGVGRGTEHSCALANTGQTRGEALGLLPGLGAPRGCGCQGSSPGSDTPSPGEGITWHSQEQSQELWNVPAWKDLKPPLSPPLLGQGHPPAAESSTEFSSWKWAQPGVIQGDSWQNNPGMLFPAAALPSACAGEGAAATGRVGHPSPCTEDLHYQSFSAQQRGHCSAGPPSQAQREEFTATSSVGSPGTERCNDLLQVTLNPLELAASRRVCAAQTPPWTF